VARHVNLYNAAILDYALSLINFDSQQQLKPAIKLSTVTKRSAVHGVQGSLLLSPDVGCYVSQAAARLCDAGAATVQASEERAGVRVFLVGCMSYDTRGRVNQRHLAATVFAC